MKSLSIALVASVQFALAIAPATARPTLANTVRATKSTTTTAMTLARAADKPFSKIYTAVKYVDSGATLSVTGVGRGFDANLSYISFFYGTGSVARGSLACLPPTPNNLTIPQMIVGYWLPVGSTIRTLTVVQSGASYAPLSAIGTMSVRYDTNPTQAITPATLTPGRFFLNSCAFVTTGTTDDYSSSDR